MSCWIASRSRRATCHSKLAVLRRAGLVTQRREGGAVIYAVSVPEVRDLLLAARTILLGLLDDADVLKRQLRTV